MTVRESTAPAPTGARWRRAARSDPAPLVARAPRWPHPVIVTPLLAFAALAQWAMLRPAIPSDAISYFGWASTIADNPISHGPTRLGVVVPVSVAIRVFGASELAFHVVPVGMFLLLVLGVYLLGTQLFGQYVGVLAAVAVTTSTLVFEYSSHPLPDPFAATWFVSRWHRSSRADSCHRAGDGTGDGCSAPSPSAWPTWPASTSSSWHPCWS
jgi:hypothetical protein